MLLPLLFLSRARALSLRPSFSHSPADPFKHALEPARKLAQQRLDLLGRGRGLGSADDARRNRRATLLLVLRAHRRALALGFRSGAESLSFFAGEELVAAAAGVVAEAGREEEEGASIDGAVVVVVAFAFASSSAASCCSCVAVVSLRLETGARSEKKSSTSDMESRRGFF